MTEEVRDPEAAYLVAGSNRTQMVREVVAYIRSRGLAPDDDQAHLLERLLELPIRHHSSRVTVGKAAALMYTSRRSLARRCQAAGLPSPGRILSVGRILNTLQLARKTGWPIVRTAAATGWPDSFTFSNAMHGLTGLRPSAARDYNTTVVLDAWLREEIATGGIRQLPERQITCRACGRQLGDSRGRASPR